MRLVYTHEPSQKAGDSHMKKLVALVVIAMLLSRTFAGAMYYPTSGDFWYNGQWQADSYTNWGCCPGGWLTADPGYEHDFATNYNYFTSCTTWTDLPYGYDDCPTAGVDETGNLWVFSYGSFHAQYTVQNTSYYGSWTFGGGSSGSDPYYLQGQEVTHAFCSGDSIWCMGAVRTTTLGSGTLYWGQSQYWTW
jgi:hypothetical protein